MATRKIGPALAAGCSVILKPASETPLTALAIVAILAEAGVPDGVVNIVPSTRSNDLSSALLDEPLVRKVSFYRIDRGRTPPSRARLPYRRQCGHGARRQSGWGDVQKW